MEAIKSFVFWVPAEKAIVYALIEAADCGGISSTAETLRGEVRSGAGKDGKIRRMTSSGGLDSRQNGRMEL